MCRDWRLLARKALAAAKSWCLMGLGGDAYAAFSDLILGCNWGQKLGWMSVTNQVLAISGQLLQKFLFVYLDHH